MAALPQKARVVIVGVGGIVGASIVHHLVERGWDDIVGIDKSGVPTDIGSTAHASDFCYATSHDYLTTWTTLYSIDFFEKMGHYSRIGGLEVARVGDDQRMDEIRRKVASGKAFGTRAELVDPATIKAKFPLIVRIFWVSCCRIVISSGELVHLAEFLYSEPLVQYCVMY